MNSEMTLKDKFEALWKIRNSIALATVHELERIKANKCGVNQSRFYPFIEQMYEHYVVKGLPKPYLCNH